MKKLYPLKFKPAWKPKAWGGEFWDLCGFEDDASLVSEGFLADNDLPDILETYMGDLVGDEIFEWHNLYFPLLIKRLIVEERLSVQVHPDDTVAAERFDDYGKTEFWYVLEADPDARIYMGFKEDCDAATLYKACKEGWAQDLLNAYAPKPGDCFFIPTGTVHAACGKLKMSEIQESSDLTFRLYDWGREFNPATRRAIHLDEALDCINYKKYDEAACSCHLNGLREASGGDAAKASGDPADNGVRVLVSDPHFVITSVRLTTPARIRLEDFKSCIVLICLEGSFSVEGCSPVTAGETLLVPASLDTVVLNPAAGGAHLLQVHLPQPPKDDVYEGPEL